MVVTFMVLGFLKRMFNQVWQLCVMSVLNADPEAHSASDSMGKGSFCQVDKATGG